MKGNNLKIEIILRTGKMHELQMAENALKDLDIPYFTQEETSGGLRLAMPLATAMGPGVWWSLHVPEEYSERAKKVLETLPIDVTLNPDVWDFGPTSRVKKSWRIYALISLIITLIVIIYQLVKNLK